MSWRAGTPAPQLAQASPASKMSRRSRLVLNRSSANAVRRSAETSARTARVVSREVARTVHQTAARGTATEVDSCKARLVCIAGEYGDRLTIQSAGRRQLWSRLDVWLVARPTAAGVARLAFRWVLTFGERPSSCTHGVSERSARRQPEGDSLCFALARAAGGSGHP